jgi:hypothetical protein
VSDETSPTGWQRFATGKHREGEEKAQYCAKCPLYKLAPRKVVGDREAQEKMMHITLLMSVLGWRPQSLTEMEILFQNVCR